MRQRRGVADIFIADQWLVVGKGDPDIAQVSAGLRQRDQLLRTDRIRRDGKTPAGPGLRDLMILAERAAQVASQASGGKDPAARMKMEEGLFFDGIQSQGRQLSVEDGLNPSAPADSGAAGAGLPFAQLACPETDTAFRHSDPFLSKVFLRLPPVRVRYAGSLQIVPG